MSTVFVVQDNSDGLVLPPFFTKQLSDDGSKCWFVSDDADLDKYNPIEYFSSIDSLHEYIYGHGWSAPIDTNN
jgi:hypothetical protein